MLSDAALKAACPHIHRLRFPFNLPTHTYTCAADVCVLRLHLTLWLTLPPPSPEVEPDIIGVFRVCSQCNKEMKWGSSCRKGSLCQGRECWPRSTDVLCLSAWSHINEASVWIPASLTLVPPAAALKNNNNNNLSKTALSIQSGMLFHLKHWTERPVCRRPTDAHSPALYFRWL